VVKEHSKLKKIKVKRLEKSACGISYYKEEAKPTRQSMARKPSKEKGSTSEQKLGQGGNQQKRTKKKGEGRRAGPLFQKIHTK